MIKVKLHKIAAEHGIKNAYQFQKFTGYPPGMASRLWNRNWKNASLSTLNTLCNLFGCTPNDILEFSPDREE